MRVRRGVVVCLTFDECPVAVALVAGTLAWWTGADVVDAGGSTETETPGVAGESGHDCDLMRSAGLLDDYLPVAAATNAANALRAAETGGGGLAGLERVDEGRLRLAAVALHDLTSAAHAHAALATQRSTRAPDRARAPRSRRCCRTFNRTSNSELRTFFSILSLKNS